MGKIACIDLTAEDVDIKETPVELKRDYIGGRGMAAKYLYDHVDPATTAWDEDNLLIFSAGLFTGSFWPSAASYSISTKSPLNGGYAWTWGSGFFGAEMKNAGYDMLVIKGQASRPLYLLVEDQNISLQDASAYWGQTTLDANIALKKDHDGASVASIGPAGEEKVLAANIVSDEGWPSDRGQVGAVMGHKKLKALVVKASEKVKNPPSFMNVVRRITPQVRYHPKARRYAQAGSMVALEKRNKEGLNPTKNHQLGQFADQDQVGAAALKKYKKKMLGCHADSMKAMPSSQVKEGPYQCPNHLGPSLQAAWALGPHIGNKDPELLLYAHYRCLSLGLDVTALAGLLAFVMEAGQADLIQADDSGRSYEAAWGDAELITGLIEEISQAKTPLGRALADGLVAASRFVGKKSAPFALEIKGLAMPGQDLRLNPAMALGLATANNGADASYSLASLEGLDADALSNTIPDLKEGPASLLRFTEMSNALCDSLGICKLAYTSTYALSLEELADGMKALGFSVTAEDLGMTGDRIINLERMFNVRQGFSRKDDRLPLRFKEERLKVYEDLASKGDSDADTEGAPEERPLKVLADPIDLDPLVDHYYHLADWTSEGIPRGRRLKALGLGPCIADIPRS